MTAPLAPFAPRPRPGADLEVQDAGATSFGAPLTTIIGIPNGPVIVFAGETAVMESCLDDVAELFGIAADELLHRVEASDARGVPLRSIVVLDAAGQEAGMFLDQIPMHGLAEFL